VVALPCTVYKAVQDSGSESKYDGLTELYPVYSTSKLKPALGKAMSAVTNPLRNTLGLKKKEDEKWQHPLYDTEVSKGDDEQEKTGRSALSITHKPSDNMSRPGCTKRARKPFDRKAYIPE
jgi:hypothetical protein